MENWHLISSNDAVEKLQSNTQNGLSQIDAQKRYEQYGPNELIDRGMKPWWKILLDQFKGMMVLILFTSAVISIFLHEYLDAIVILAIVVLNAILGYVQESKAEKAMAALKKMAVPLVRARRDGHLQEIPASKLVPGDMILLEAGNSIPADCRLIESVNLRVQEAVLTGESIPVEKAPETLTGENLPIGDRLNMLYMGTAVSYGRGSAMVVETGMNSELGHIAELLQSVGQESTPLQKRLDQMGKVLAAVAVAIVVVVFVLGLLQGEDILIMLRTAISMAVAAIPEGLTAVVTIALAFGAQRMLKRNALIRKLPAVETLGSVTVICSDKTGTLTQNRMTVTVLDTAGNKLDFQQTLRDYSPSLDESDLVKPRLVEYNAEAMMLIGSTLCNDAVLEVDSGSAGGFRTIGDPTEGALVVAAAQAGFDKKKLEETLPRISELPFDSDRKRMTTIHAYLPEQLDKSIKSLWEVRHPEGSWKFLAITKGAVDGLLKISNRVWTNDQIIQMNDDWRERILTSNEQIASNGMRVLGLAVQFRPNSDIKDIHMPIEDNLIFVGLIGMIDPARPEVKDAVNEALSAGIKPMMITGDHPLTALYIARELNITDNDNVVTGQELAEMDDAQLVETVSKTTVYARVSPEHKLRIVNALQSQGHIVAMTGDGVNDAPALKKADIGVAMGITGTDVSKEASDMVLLDDNFATIVSAVREGRRIYDNIRKFIRYMMPANAGEIIVMLAAPLFGLPIPLTPLQILWVNLVTDGLPGLALAQEPAERNVMKRPPRSPNENLFDKRMVLDILWIGIAIGLISLLSGFFPFLNGKESWHTMIFTTLTMAQLGQVIAVRSERDLLVEIGVFTNKQLFGTIILTIALQIAVIYVPFMQKIFDTKPLSPIDLLISMGAGVVVFAIVELSKLIWRAFERRKAPTKA
jgi:Ca2+-transporting ATPase